MNKQIQNIKQHFKNYVDLYVVAGVTAVVVAGVTYYVTKNGKLAAKAVAAVEYAGDTVIHNQASIGGLSWKPTVNVINFVENSTPSTRVGLLDENGGIRAVFNSINEAARQTGADRSAISKVVHGISEHAKGMKFVDLPAEAVAA